MNTDMCVYTQTHAHTHSPKHHRGAHLPISSLHTTCILPQTHTGSGGILRCRIWHHPAPREEENTDRGAREAGEESPNLSKKPKWPLKGPSCALRTVVDGAAREPLLHPVYRKEGECSEKRSPCLRIPAHLRRAGLGNTLPIDPPHSIQDKHLPRRGESPHPPALSLWVRISVPRERYR